MEELQNLMEETVLEKIDSIWKEENRFCKCDKCKYDIAAFALNRLPARYVSTLAGAMLHKFESQTTQTDAEITAVVYRAIQVIGEEPHKNSKEN